MTVITTSGQDRLSAAFAAWEQEAKKVLRGYRQDGPCDLETAERRRLAAGVDIRAVLDSARCANCVHYTVADEEECRLHPQPKVVRYSGWCGEHPTRAAVAAYLESEALSALFGGPNEREPYPCRS